MENPRRAAPTTSVKFARITLCCVQAFAPPGVGLNTQIAPAALLSAGPPMAATNPSADKARACPWLEGDVPPVPTNLPPCCVQVIPVRVKAQNAPMPVLSPGPPMRMVLPFPDIATAVPCRAAPVAPVPVNLTPCCVHTPSLKTKIQAAPALVLSVLPPMTAVLPFAAIATEIPWPAAPVAPVPTSLLPCWIQKPSLLRVKIQAAPAPLLSAGAPMMAVVPSPEMATEVPCCAAPTAPVPINSWPCCVQRPALRVKIHAPPMPVLSPEPPTMAVFPSADSATAFPCCAEPVAPVPTSFEPCCWRSGYAPVCANAGALMAANATASNKANGATRRNALICVSPFGLFAGLLTG